MKILGKVRKTFSFISSCLIMKKPHCPIWFGIKSNNPPKTAIKENYKGFNWRYNTPRLGFSLKKTQQCIHSGWKSIQNFLKKRRDCLLWIMEFCLLFPPESTNLKFTLDTHSRANIGDDFQNRTAKLYKNACMGVKTYWYPLFLLNSA